MNQEIKILDNRSLGFVHEEIRRSVMPDGRASILSPAFSLYAYSELKSELNKLAKVRLLVPNSDSESTFGSKLAGCQCDRRFRNNLTVSAIAREFSQWVHKKCEMKKASTPVSQSFIHIEDKQSESLTSIFGSSTFTTDGLGIVPSGVHHMNSCFVNSAEAYSLLKQFNDMWNNSSFSDAFSESFGTILERIFSDKAPALSYFLVLYHIFKDFIGELDEEKIIKSQTGIKGTRVWQKLYKFQRDGVLGAIDKIERYNGCIIADSVGLGKTFEALAVIKYYELRNDRVLVLCPKKLRENWSLYTINDKRNILAADRFNYDILNHTDLTRHRGMSGEINLETINWGNYDLVVIDESHNFRNNPARKDEITTRYTKLMNDIIQRGVKTKVLMLSATPVNNRMNDLKNQVAFIVEGKDNALAPFGINSLEHTLKLAQTRFNAWVKMVAKERTTEKLLESLNFDYFKLLDLLTIARSRKHIVKYYDIAEIGKFPERLTPVNTKTDIDVEGQFPPIKEINRDIRILNLSAYAPLKYLLQSKVEEYSRKYDRQVSGGSVFRQVDREQSLIHLMRVNLFKRMESSINSFSLTLQKLLGDVENLITKITTHDTNTCVEELDIEDIEVEDDSFSPFVVGNKVKVLIQDMDTIRWKQELEEDRDILKKVLVAAQAVPSHRDEKLQNLKSMIQKKAQQPINPGNKKVIVFTAFADTANYLYENLSTWAHKELGVYSALITGTGNNKTTMPNIRKDLASLITSFSPISKEREKVDPFLTDEIDLLIATDCISEGQNLQDCDYLINYDIHWNPVRIIQRFGRIDRLGSKNARIQLVNYWPNLELDEYINLEARVSGRMVLLDISATGEENVIEFTDSSKMNDLEYRRKQLEKLQTEVIDIDEIEGGISITDLTLNDFRMDLSEYLKTNEDYLQSIPYGTYSVTSIPDELEKELVPGAIFCLKNEGKQAIADATYALSPYYLVYLADDGEVVLQFTQAKKILDILKKIGVHGKEPDSASVAQFNRKTSNGREMTHYQNLLAKAVNALTGAAEERGVASLFSPGGTVISKTSFKGVDDFEVVSFVAILGKDTDNA